MTEPTEAQIKEACDLLIQQGCSIRWNPKDYSDYPPLRALACLIAQRDTERAKAKAEHEAAMQRVSEIADDVRMTILDPCCSDEEKLAAILVDIRSLILPDPTPTPEQVLAEAIKACGIWDSGETLNTRLIGALAKRGHHVAPIKDTRHD